MISEREKGLLADIERKLEYARATAETDGLDEWASYFAEAIAKVRELRNGKRSLND